jgi:condensin complex subunit 2
MEGKLTFQKLLNDLPEKVSGQTARNLSVPIAFVCLLHLANEKVSVSSFVENNLVLFH